MTEKIADGIVYAGVDDTDIDLFEGQYTVPNGMAYNSYVVRGSKSAVLDTTDARFYAQWLANVKEALEGAAPDYLVVHHMEPDHSSCIAKFLEEFPSAKVVSSAQAFKMMCQFFGTDFADRRIVVKEGDVLDLGGRPLAFVAAPMVHWPEVMVSYEAATKTLFSADGFGKFGVRKADEEWACEARRYYFGIVGKFGPQVQALLKKAAGLDIARICPLHGPILTENLGYYLNLYDIWSSYGAEAEGVFVAYTSVYGHTKEAALLLAEELKKAGCPKVATADLARDDMAECVEDAFKYGKIVLATTTYNMDVFPFMRTFVEHLKERNWQKRTVGLVENGTWAPAAAKTIKALLADSKEISFAEPVVTIRSALDGASRAQIAQLAAAMAK